GHLVGSRRALRSLRADAALRATPTDALEETNPVIIGVPKEIKPGEQRVGLTPAGVQTLVGHGHRVLVEPGAGTGSGFRDDDYTQLGAQLRPVDAVWAEADMVIKVKEPIKTEHPRLRANQILFTYLHLAAVPDLTRALQKAG